MLRHLIQDETGNITIYSVFMLVLILTITGASVDIMRFETNRTVMQNTMDRAVLAAADLDQTQDPKTVVKDYLANSPVRSLVPNVEVFQAANSRTVSATGTSSMDPIFLHMSGVDQLIAPAKSVAEEKISNVEISLVLDISGSMRNNDRINKMKPAATSFVDKVMTDDSNGVTTLNLVPFAGQVNPGDILFDYFRGERPKINQNNGWGNGDQDAPGNSLCNNNAENADEGAASEECAYDDGSSSETATAAAIDDAEYFKMRNQNIVDMVYYFDVDDDGIYDVTHKVENYTSDASRDPDDHFKGFVAAFFAADDRLTTPEQFLGASVQTSNKKIYYYQVKGDENGQRNDIGPTLNKGNHRGDTHDYSGIDLGYWEQFYVSPNQSRMNAEAAAAAEAALAEEEGREVPPGIEKKQQNMNMPSSCVEIYPEEFNTTAMPTSEDYVPHFMYWPIDETHMDWGWCPSEEMTIQYYSDDRSALIDFIDEMRLHDGTGLQYGMKYGLALLDPVNQSALSALIEAGLVDERFEGRPIQWGDSETEKYIVMMSDGAVTPQYRPNDGENPSNATTDLRTQGSSSYYTMTAGSQAQAEYRAQCDLARANGVTVFTVAFETTNAEADALAYCASSASHAFHVTGDEIADTFDTIARQINNLRLIQ
ncbi:pilus assembly protein TadG-related protein [Sagittula sp. SSi028]|uniref:TadE/TadG family type IV pilus assembly protein n=1 Tax=Sagittula sp. SSi028 TaxID=3400636 RepID=UPI003AF6FA45